MEHIIMHVDVNSAFLSWTAAYEKQIGIDRDIRKLNSVIGGDEKSRRGIVLSCSIPAKKYGIITGESLFSSRQKCPNLIIVPPKYKVFVKASKVMMDYLNSFTPEIEQYSIDESFIRFKDINREKAITLAYKIKDSISEIFGYTVNIGISTNKLLAKQAGDFSKPNKVHTLFPEEIETKFWPLPIENLFFVGRKTAPKLRSYGITTIGELANADRNFIKSILKKPGELIHSYANGIDNSEFSYTQLVKSIGNSSTIKFDVVDMQTAHIIIMGLTEQAAWRLREHNLKCSVVCLSLKSTDFYYQSRQRKLSYQTNSTTEIYRELCNLFDETWNGFWNKKPIRQIGVSLTDFDKSQLEQLSIFKSNYSFKLENLDRTIDSIRRKYGETIITRGIIKKCDFLPILGGYPDDDYKGMRSIL